MLNTIPVKFVIEQNLVDVIYYLNIIYVGNSVYYYITCGNTLFIPSKGFILYPVVTGHFVNLTKSEIEQYLNNENGYLINKEDLLKEFELYLQSIYGNKSNV